jgi:hypothetical protein
MKPLHAEEIPFWIIGIYMVKAGDTKTSIGFIRGKESLAIHAIRPFKG